MKRRIWGLKKVLVEELIQKMESDFLAEKNAIEYELNSLLEENNKLRIQLRQKPKMNINSYEDEPVWNLGKERIKGITNYLCEQHEHEMVNMQEVFSERKKVIQLQLEEMDVEIQSIEQLSRRMSNLMAELEEKTVQVDIIEESIIEETRLVDFQIEPPASLLVGESLNLEETASELNGEEDCLIEQIEAIKFNYIVGKVAGEDLVDLQGNLIIAKFDIITEQVVNHAHHEGKLADLVVNMKITGLGEG